MAESRFLSSPSLLFNSKTKSTFFSLPSKPLKLHLNSSLSLTKTKTNRSPVRLFVAQTSDWAQQEEGDTLATLPDEQPATETAADEFQSGEEQSYEEGFAEPSEDAKLFVGNLPYDVDSEKLAMLFEQAGTVEIAEVTTLSLLFLFSIINLFVLNSLMVLLHCICYEILKLNYYGCCLGYL